MSVTLIKRFTFKIIFIFSIFEKLGFLFERCYMERLVVM